MDTSVEIRNSFIEKVREFIDVTQDGAHHFHVTMREGGNFSAQLLSKALHAVPKDAAISLDIRACGGLDESIAGAIITHRRGDGRTLITTDAGIARLISMRFLNQEGTPRPGTEFSWKVLTSMPDGALDKRPATEILQNLAGYLQELDRPSEKLISHAPALEQLVSVATTDNMISVKVMAPIRGDQSQLLQDYLKNLPPDKRLLVDLQELGPDSTTSGYGVLMAAKIRKKLGATPLEVVNIPASLARLFNPEYSATLGFTITDPGTVKT